MEIKDIVEQEKHKRSVANIVYVEQDIEYKMTCDSCGKVAGECDFQEHQDCGNLCDVCYEEKGGDV